MASRLSRASPSIPSFSANCDSGFCLPWDADMGLKWAELLAQLRTTGKAMPINDTRRRR
jgi:hypothetical protein